MTYINLVALAVLITATLVFLSAIFVDCFDGSIQLNKTLKSLFIERERLYVAIGNNFARKTKITIGRNKYYGDFEIRFIIKGCGILISWER